MRSVPADWQSLGVFFVALLTMFGGMAAWIMRRLDKNRADWKEFVASEVSTAKVELTAQFAGLSQQVALYSSEQLRQGQELTDQGKAIARIEGRLGTSPSMQGSSA